MTLYSLWNRYYLLSTIGMNRKSYIEILNQVKLSFFYRFLENIIIDHQLNIKVIDFGLSFLSKSHQLTHTNCGTLIFMAPEMVSKKQYFKSVDIWSCGIIQYILLNGRHPLWNPEIDTKDTYLEKINQPIIWDFPRNMSK